jgi:hypothetical protein
VCVFRVEVKKDSDSEVILFSFSSKDEAKYGIATSEAANKSFSLCSQENFV